MSKVKQLLEDEHYKYVQRPELHMWEQEYMYNERQKYEAFKKKNKEIITQKIKENKSLQMDEGSSQRGSIQDHKPQHEIRERSDNQEGVQPQT